MSHPHPDLAAPGKLARNGLRIVPLGGLGEIGRNMTVFEHGGRLLIVDCGVLFPDPDQPGVDLILPDFGYLDGRLDQVEALVLTHAHEDHIGAIPYLLRERPDIPLVGSRLTLALVQSKLAEHRLDPVTVEVVEGGRGSFGPFDCEFLAVNHSIPDALAVAIRTPAGLVLHTGDFKMDQLPLDGRLTDLAGFARLGSEGVDLLIRRLDQRRGGGHHAGHLGVGRVGHQQVDALAAEPGETGQVGEPAAPAAACVIFKSPVCSTRPAGVRMATAVIGVAARGTRRSGGPPSTTSTVTGSRRCSASLLCTRARVSLEPTSGMSGRSLQQVRVPRRCGPRGRA